MARILIVEDEIVLANAMADALAGGGHTTDVAHAGEKVIAKCRGFQPQVVILDVRLGAVSGIDLLATIKAEWPEIEVIVATAYGSVEIAVEAMKRGAAEFLTKPIDLDVLATKVESVWSASQARRRLEQFETAQQERLKQVNLIGQCPAIKEIRTLVDRLAERSATAGAPPTAILLTGETGTGKDLLAGLLHSRLPRRQGPFVGVNCAAVPAELFESELFGHKRGAFSGATADKAGLFETADGGTLMLDEIADMPLALQPKLLRALETQTIRRVGETRDRELRICVIAATNRDLQRAVAEHRFREDLYFRLKVVTIELPPLRQRGQDIEMLADHFCAILAGKYALPALRLTPEAREALAHYSWPGNVRELLNALERSALVGSGPEITSADLRLTADAHRVGPASPAEMLLANLTGGQAIDLDALEKAILEQALQQTGGNASAAARLLSIGREAMRYRMSKFGLATDREGESPAQNGA